jgi:hypothetical protein
MDFHLRSRSQRAELRLSAEIIQRFARGFTGGVRGVAHLFDALCGDRLPA